MRRSYTVFFLCLFIACITAGLGFERHFDYAMLIGTALGIFFLICAAFVMGKKRRKSNLE
jgi:hypothetical membrane protein